MRSGLSKERGLQKSGTLADEPVAPAWHSAPVIGPEEPPLRRSYRTDDVYLLALWVALCVCAGPKFQDPKATLARRISVKMDGGAMHINKCLVWQS